MHPVKFSWCFFPPIAGNASIVRVRESGVGLGFRIAGTSVGPTRLEPLLGTFPFTGVFGHPTCTPESSHDAPTASRAADDADDFTRYLQVPEQARPTENVFKIRYYIQGLAIWTR